MQQKVEMLDLDRRTADQVLDGDLRVISIGLISDIKDIFGKFSYFPNKMLIF
jgi:hypothetical protein